MGLLYGENFMILPSTVFLCSTHLTDRQTDGRTDRWATAYTLYCKYAVARNKTNNDT